MVSITERDRAIFFAVSGWRATRRRSIATSWTLSMLRVSPSSNSGSIKIMIAAEQTKGMVYCAHVEGIPMKETLELPLQTARSFNRWFIPVGAVAVHICIGSVYAWSTFNRPIQSLFPNEPWWFSPPYTTFTTALVLLGLSAAFGGPWVERRGPRAAATAAALFFGIGLIIGGIGLAIKEPILVFLGMGIIGGIGCGLGYISPVSTLVKWFPDRRGMATGMAIMGFGGGAFLAGYLNVFFMEQ